MLNEVKHLFGPQGKLRERSQVEAQGRIRQSLDSSFRSE
jgi:hypothetical protein